MTSKTTTRVSGEGVSKWVLPYAATLGSSVRIKGILQYLRARLPPRARKALEITASDLTLRVTAGSEGDAWRASVFNSLEGIEAIPVIPREIEDILSISTTERHRWLKDGRLPSAGTRTVQLRGRSRKITFHVFDPRMVEELLDRDAVVEWREADAATAAENRRRAAWKAKLKREESMSVNRPSKGSAGEESPGLLGWEEFARDGLLR